MNSATFGEHVKESRLIRLELGVIVALLLLTALVWLPKYQVNQDLKQGLIQREEVPEHVDRYRRTLAQIFGGVVVLAGLYFTYRRVLSTERNVEIAREGQITERFTRAIEQLGDERLAVRLGGIYALERIARDSERDHRTVMEVLMAFVRENAPPVEEEEREKVAPDVQAALTVIGRRNTAYDLEGRILDLRRVSIPEAILHRINFSKAKLREANLGGVTFYEIDFTDANLWTADFTGAILRGADFTGADLAGASFVTATLGEVDFDRADLRDADFTGATLSEVDFIGALVEADFIGAFVNEVDFRSAILYGADFSGAKLLGADFTGASYDLKQLAEAASVEDIKGLSDEELAELERLRQEADEDDQQPEEEGDSQ